MQIVRQERQPDLLLPKSNHLVNGLMDKVGWAGTHVIGEITQRLHVSVDNCTASQPLCCASGPGSRCRAAICDGRK